MFLILIYKMGEKMFNKDVGLISGLILVSIPTVVFMSTKIMTDIPGAFLFSASLCFYYLGLKNPKYFLLGGFVGGISIMMKDMNFLLIPVLLVYALAFWKKISLKYFIASLFIGLASASPYFIDNFIRWGDPLFRIIHHIDYVNKGIGYKSFPLQDISFSWIIFLPITLGIPIFYLFALNLYKNRKHLYSNIKLKFLLIWFSVLFIIFLLGQKIDLRLGLVFAIPVLLIGSNELMSNNNFKIFLLIVLILNGFLFYNITNFEQIKLSESHKEVFNFITKNIPQNQTIYSNFDPPSLIAWYTNRTVFYSTSSDAESKLIYYLYNGKASLNPEAINVNGYNIIFNNSIFTLYQRRL
jgi:4-amino-4-deoxy-L-arabinose transferase-like glycosyltransferase